jgi:hypothetical protein
VRGVTVFGPHSLPSMQLTLVAIVYAKFSFAFANSFYPVY